MKLDDSQKQQIAQWVNDGATLSEVQTKIYSEFGVSMTYMDVRFLVDDLNLELKEKSSEQKSVPAEKTEENIATDEQQSSVPATPANADTVPAENLAAENPSVSVSVDPVQAAGIIVGGSVRFSDGTMGKWLVDQSGQLGLDGLPEGYRPSRNDVAQFQIALKAELRKLGYQ